MFAKFIFCTVLILLYSSKIIAKNTWILDKELSEITFELPVLLANKIRGQFTKFDGSVVIDQENKENNRALFSIQINSMNLNYDKYKELLLSNVFFDEANFPIIIIDTKKFNILDNSNTLQINAELQIKDIVHIIPLMIEINHLSNDWVQIKTDFKFSRTAYELGKGSWSSTLILRDKIRLKANLFLNRE